jgi:hypothetical protein
VGVVQETAVGLMYVVCEEYLFFNTKKQGMP